MTRWRRLLVPGISTLVMLAVLCGLGLWQVHRLAWKTALLDRIAEAERLPGVDLPADPKPYEKVRVAGRIRPPFGRYGVDVRDTPSGPLLGSQVVGLLDAGGGGLPIVSLYGWMPADARFTPPVGETAFEAYVRRPERAGWFSPADSPPQRQFYTLDPAAIGLALGVPQVAPFALVRMGKPEPGMYPAPAETMPRPPNDHLSYAITWFGLAATLVVVFGVYARRVLAAR